MRHPISTSLPNWSPQFDARYQASWVEKFCSWTIMQDSTRQETQTNTFVSWDGEDWITRPTVPILSHQTFLFYCIEVNTIEKSMKRENRLWRNSLHRWRPKFINVISWNWFRGTKNILVSVATMWKHSQKYAFVHDAIVCFCNKASLWKRMTYFRNVHCI